jgi:hypothetical protein
MAKQAIDFHYLRAAQFWRRTNKAPSSVDRALVDTKKAAG